MHRVKAAMNSDVCSVYVRDAAAPQYVLMATDGLNPGSVGKIRMAAGEGIVGLVATRQEPVNLANAAEHPSYRHFPETGEAAVFRLPRGSAGALPPVRRRARRPAKDTAGVRRGGGRVPGHDRRAGRGDVELRRPGQRHLAARAGPARTDRNDPGVAGRPGGDDRQHCPPLAAGRTRRGGQPGARRHREGRSRLQAGRARNAAGTARERRSHGGPAVRGDARDIRRLHPDPRPGRSGRGRGRQDSRRQLGAGRAPGHHCRACRRVRAGRGPVPAGARRGHPGHRSAHPAAPHVRCLRGKDLSERDGPARRRGQPRPRGGRTARSAPGHRVPARLRRVAYGGSRPRPRDPGGDGPRAARHQSPSTAIRSSSMVIAGACSSTLCPP